MAMTLPGSSIAGRQFWDIPSPGFPTPVNKPESMEDIIKSYLDVFNQNRSVKESNFQDILTGYRERYDRNIGRLEGMGETERARINKSYDQAFQGGVQDLVSSGLANSTLKSNLRTGIEAGRAEAQGALDERLREQMFRADAQLSGDKLAYQERRPFDMFDYGWLAGAGGGGGGGGRGTVGGRKLHPGSDYINVGAGTGFRNVGGNSPDQQWKGQVTPGTSRPNNPTWWKDTNFPAQRRASYW